jgi:restriction system protein
LEILGPGPNEGAVRHDFNIPDERPFLELLLPFLRSRRQRLEEEAAEEFRQLSRRYRAGEKRVISTYNERVHAYNQSRRDAKRQYESQLTDHERQKQAFLANQESHNRAVAEFRAHYERGYSEAMERLVQMVLDRSAYPDGVTGDPDVLFDEPSRTLVANFWLPHMSQVPNTVEYKFVIARKEVRRIEMKKADFQAFYDEILYQIALRTIYETFHGDYRRHVQAVVFNGWVRGLDPKTGKEFTSCVLSCHAPREQFEGFDLAHVSARECVRGLRGITAGPLAELAPVRPIMAINRDDDRFVEAKAVLGRLVLQP